MNRFSNGDVAIVFGCGGGVGGALVKRMQVDQRFERVISFGRYTSPPINFLSEATLKAAASSASDCGDIRVVIDATGFLHDEVHRPEKSWRELDSAQMTHSFLINAIGPALLMKYFLPLLPRSGKAVFATLSARVGSISDNHLGGWYSYRASKAALNQLVRTAAIELRRSRPDAICVALHPGTVDTRLSAPFVKDGLEVQSPDTAAARLLHVINHLSTEDSGNFFDQHGKKVAW